MNEFLPSKIKVMSFNILSDIYDNKITSLDKRKDDLLNFIIEQNCDIICLQEVTDYFHTELLKLSDYKCNITNCKTNNIAILSKINPINCIIIDLDNRGSKKALKLQFKTNEIQSLTVVGIHLTSDTHKNSKSTRIQQISKIINNINTKYPCIILGDTNEVGTIDQLSNFVDSNNSTVVTYDPQDNIFAKKFSSKGIKCRYDRIYHNLLGCMEFNVIKNNTLSDHYPV